MLIRVAQGRADAAALATLERRTATPGGEEIWQPFGDVALLDENVAEVHDFNAGGALVLGWQQLRSEGHRLFAVCAKHPQERRNAALAQHRGRFGADPRLEGLLGDFA